MEFVDSEIQKFARSHKEKTSAPRECGGNPALRQYEPSENTEGEETFLVNVM